MDHHRINGGNMVSKKQQACVNRYMRDNYDRINLTVPKGEKESIKEHAAEFDGGSVNGFIQRAIREAMKRDRAKKDGGK